MKIVCKGKIRFTCDECFCVFNVYTGEYKLVDIGIYGRFASYHCPECNEEVLYQYISKKCVNRKNII